MTDNQQPTVQFWFDPASSYSYLSAERIETLATASGISVDWRAFLLGPVFQGQGWESSPFNQQPAKLRYMWRDVERQCATRRIPFRRPGVLPRNSVLAARIACYYREAAWLPAFVRAVYRANFAADQDIADPAVIADCLQAVDQSPAPVMAAAQSAGARPLLRDATTEAMALGIFGAPSFVVAGELFWGDDRLEQAVDWATKLGDAGL